jgi:hypothetical protein
MGGLYIFCSFVFLLEGKHKYCSYFYPTVYASIIAQIGRDHNRYVLKPPNTIGQTSAIFKILESGVF